jgi:hypothetical protein
MLFIVIVSQVACGQPVKQVRTKPYLYVDSLFSKENYTTEFLDFEFDKDIQEILLRMQNAMAANKDWTEQYFSKYYKPGEGLPYHENMGITKEEYQKIKNIDKSPPRVVIKSTGSLKINRSKGSLSFKTNEEDTKFMEAFKIDFKNEVLLLSNDTIPFAQEINSTSSTPFGEWHGYSWKKEISNIGEKDDIKFETFNTKIVELNFGRTIATNKIFFRLKYKEINKLDVKANIDMMCYLK